GESGGKEKSRPRCPVKVIDPIVLTTKNNTTLVYTRVVWSTPLIRYDSANSAGASGRLRHGRNAREGVVGIATERRDGGDAHHDDQGQHDGVFDCCRAVFLLHELNELLGDLTHCSAPRFGEGFS